MKLTGILKEDLVKLELEAVSRKEVVGELVQLLADNDYIRSRDVAPVTEVVLLREGLGSTAIGKGLAFLHAEIGLVGKCVVVVGRSRTGVEMESLDGGPTHVVFLILSHPDDKDKYLSVLKRLLDLLGREKPCERMLAANNAKEVLKCVRSRR